MSTKTWADEVIVYGSKNSILIDTINYTNEFNKENERKAKENTFALNSFTISSVISSCLILLLHINYAKIGNSKPAVKQV
jgi:hypothetical protein